MHGETFDFESKKVSFYGEEWDFLGHGISNKSIEVSKAKFDFIANFPFLSL